jgi:hypothetical protein
MSTGKKVALWGGAALVLLLVLGALFGDSTSEKDERSSTSTESSVPSAPQPPPATTVAVRSPDGFETVRMPTVKITGVSEPGAKVKLSGDAGTKRAKANAKGRWGVTMPLDVGSNSIDIVANADGHSRGSTGLTVTRRRSAQEIAAIRQRKLERQQQKRQAFIASAVTLPYNQLEKNADEYAGKRVKYTGQIFQIQEDYGSSVILLAVTDEGYGFWTDNIWVDYDGEIDSAEDDVITVYGTVTGSKSYETQIGGETYVPQIKGKYIDE